MLDRNETMIFAAMLKRLGGEINLSPSELLAVDGWRVDFYDNFETGGWRAKLTRVGTTIEGEVTRRDDSPSENSRGLRPQQPRLSMRHAFLAQEPLSERSREVPPSPPSENGE